MEIKLEHRSWAPHIQLYKLMANKITNKIHESSSYGVLQNKVIAVASFDLRIGTTLFAELLIFYCVLCAMGQHASAVSHFL